MPPTRKWQSGAPFALLAIFANFMKLALLAVAFKTPMKIAISISSYHSNADLKVLRLSDFFAVARPVIYIGRGEFRKNFLTAGDKTGLSNVISEGRYCFSCF